MKEYLKIIDYVNHSPWKDDSDIKTIIDSAKKVYKDITFNKSRGKLLYRLCGQTGSGKTSQLLAAFEEYMKQKEIDPIVLGVRTCYKYHPQYEELLRIYGKNNIREATNGFALKCMSYVLKLLIENNFIILLDITLLSPEYEKYVLDLLNKNNYVVNYHIMAVNNDISDIFIKKRYLETGRVVSNESKEYFNYILEIGLKYLCENDLKNMCYVWNAYEKEYKYKGNIKDCFNVFIEQKKLKQDFIYSEEELRQAKLKILLDQRF